MLVHRRDITQHQVGRLIYTPQWYNALSPSGPQLKPLDPKATSPPSTKIYSRKQISSQKRVCGLGGTKRVNIGDEKKQTFNYNLPQSFVCAKLRIRLQNKCPTSLSDRFTLFKMMV